MKSTTLGIAVLAFVTFTAPTVSSAGDSRDLSSVNGSVTAKTGQTYDTVSTVNGDVRVESGATVEEAKAVNGEVTIDHDAKVGAASTVNGSLTIRDGAAVAREASTVNGGIELGRRAHVGGDVTTVSGDIELNGAEVGGKLATRNGDIELTDGAHVRGAIEVKKKNEHGWGFGSDDPVNVHICATCVVDGELRFERPVELRVDLGAKIGKVIGDSVTRR